MEDQNTTQPTSPDSALKSVPVAHEGTKTPHGGFTPIDQLFKDAWALMTKKLLKMIVVWVYLVLIAILFVISMVIIVLIGSIALGLGDGASGLSMNPAGMGIYGIGFIMYIVGVIILSGLQQSSFLLALNEPDENLSGIKIIKKSFKFIIPVFIVSLLSMIVVFGGTMLFVIPGIIMGIMLAFIMYAVVLEKKSGLDALKMSVGIVQQNFGAIVGRVLAYFGGVIGAFIVIIIISSIDESLASFMALVQLVGQIVMAIFTPCFLFLLYKQARASYDETKPASMTWMWVVSAIGWVLAFLFMTTMMNFAKNLPSDAFDSLRDAQMEEQNNADTMYDDSVQYDVDGTEMPDELNQLFDTEMQKQIEQLQQEAGNEI